MPVKFLLAALLAASLSGCVVLAPETRDMASRIHAGLSAEDHLRVATFFEHKAFAYDREAAEQERLARSYISRPHGDVQSLAPLSRQLRDQMLGAARVARQLAAEHRHAAGVVNP